VEDPHILDRVEHCLGTLVGFGGLIEGVAVVLCDLERAIMSTIYYKAY